MNSQPHPPLILIIDDQPSWREEIIPRALAPLGADLLKAGSVQEGLLIASEHDGTPNRALDLVVLDMHLPIDSDASTIDKEGGIKYLREYRLVTCPVIVFTWYASFPNCALAIEAGAKAYISKQVESETEGGLKQSPVDKLLAACRDCLYKEVSATDDAALEDEWIARNYSWLQLNFDGKYVAFLPKASIKALGKLRKLPSHVERDNFVVIGGDTYKSVRTEIIRCVPLLQNLPPIVKVAKT